MDSFTVAVLIGGVVVVVVFVLMMLLDKKGKSPAAPATVPIRAVKKR